MTAYVDELIKTLPRLTFDNPDRGLAEREDRRLRLKLGTVWRFKREHQLPRTRAARVHLTLPTPAAQQVDALAHQHGATRCDVIRSLVEASLEQMAAERAASTG